MTDRARFRLVAGATAGAAIAAIDLSASDTGALDGSLCELALLPLAPGAVALRRFGEIDTGIAARWSGSMATLFPHAGVAVLDGVRGWLLGAGLQEDADPDPLRLYPEAENLVEACALDAIARADSALAIDTVLAQRDLWLTPSPAPEMDAASQRRLDRLLHAPVVVLAGAPNIGKSALTNAMARRAVAVVADEPGTTRDHVGVLLDLGGLTVRWVDTPGIRADPADRVERDAVSTARSVIESADLVLCCEDASHPSLPDFATGADRIAVLTRADLAPGARQSGVATSALTGQGLDELALQVRERLVPAELLQRRERWRFHPMLP